MSKLEGNKNPIGNTGSKSNKTKKMAPKRDDDALPYFDWNEDSLRTIGISLGNIAKLADEDALDDDGTVLSKQRRAVLVRSALDIIRTLRYGAGIFDKDVYETLDHMDELEFFSKEETRAISDLLDIVSAVQDDTPLAEKASTHDAGFSGDQKDDIFNFAWDAYGNPPYLTKKREEEVSRARARETESQATEQERERERERESDRSRYASDEDYYREYIAPEIKGILADSALTATAMKGAITAILNKIPATSTEGLIDRWEKLPVYLFTTDEWTTVDRLIQPDVPEEEEEEKEEEEEEEEKEEEEEFFEAQTPTELPGRAPTVPAAVPEKPTELVFVPVPVAPAAPAAPVPPRPAGPIHRQLAVFARPQPDPTLRIDESKTVPVVKFEFDPRVLHDRRKRAVFPDFDAEAPRGEISGVLTEGEVIETDVERRVTYRAALFDGPVVDTIDGAGYDDDADDDENEDEEDVKETFGMHDYAHKPGEDKDMFAITAATADFFAFSVDKWTGIEASTTDRYRLLERYGAISQISTRALSAANAARLHLAQTLFATCLEEIPAELMG